MPDSLRSRHDEFGVPTRPIPASPERPIVTAGVRIIRERATACTQTPLILASTDERIGDTVSDASWELTKLLSSPFAACALRVARQRYGNTFWMEEPDSYWWRLTLAGSGKRGGREALVSLSITAPGGFTCSLTLGSVCVDNITPDMLMRAMSGDDTYRFGPFAEKLSNIAAIALELRKPE